MESKEVFQWPGGQPSLEATYCIQASCRTASTQNVLHLLVLLGYLTIFSQRTLQNFITYSTASTMGRTTLTVGNFGKLKKESTPRLPLAIKYKPSAFPNSLAH
jgi:hypothetical protein